MPYLAYDQVDFDVVVGSYGDCFDRYAIRLHEIRESIRIVRQCIDKMPKGDYRIQDKKVTPPPRARIDESMEALIHHFKIFTEGFKVPEGEAYVAVESPRGELGCYIVSDGSAHPYRMHIRGPSFVNLQSPAPHDARRPRGRRRRHHLLGRPDPRGGRPLMARLTAENVAARAGDHRPLPAAEVRAHPAAAPGPGAGRPRHRRGHGAHRRAGRRDPGRGAGHRLVLRDVQVRAGRAPTWSTSAPTSPASCSAARSCSHHAEQRLGIAPGQTTADGTVHPRGRRVHRGVHRGARACRSTTATSTRSTPERLRPAGRRPARRAPRRRSRRTAPSPGSASTSPPDRRAGNGRARGRAREPAWIAAPPRRPRADGHHRRAEDHHQPLRLRRQPHPRPLRRHRRVPGPPQGARAWRRPRSTTRSRPPACSGGAAPASRPG